jgi:uncharacterized protein (TIGR02246 family)
MRRLVPALSLLAMFAACQPAAPKVDAAAEEQAIRAQVAAFNKALASYDVAAIDSLYAPDAVLLPPNQERRTGTASVEQSFAGLEPLKATMVLTPVAITIAASGDLAVEEGSWVYTMPTPDGGTFKDNGKYLVAWKKADGKWRVQIDTWNSDNAPPAPAAPAAAKK